MFALHASFHLQTSDHYSVIFSTHTFVSERLLTFDKILRMNCSSAEVSAVCAAAFWTYAPLCNNLVQRTTNLEARFSCTECSAEHPTFEAMLSHMQSQHFRKHLFVNQTWLSMIAYSKLVAILRIIVIWYGVFHGMRTYVIRWARLINF